MPTPAGYILSEKDVALLRELNYTFKRLQHFVNIKGISDFVFDIDDNSATSQIYIAKTPQGGIPALTVAASTGIGDTPGSAVCTLLRKSRGVATTDTMPHSRQETVLNLSATAIPGEQWILIIRDKHGSWYALNVDSQGATIFGPGWTAGLSNEDCLYLTVSSAIGKCSHIDTTQTLLLTSGDGVIWESFGNFNYTGGSGPVIFTRPDCQALPTLQIDGYCLIWDKAGIDDNGLCYIEYKGGTSLCSDVPGTGSGTGGSRGVCCSNTFTVRLTCNDCSIPISLECCTLPTNMPYTIIATIGGAYGGLVVYLNMISFSATNITWGACPVDISGSPHAIVVNAQCLDTNVIGWTLVDSLPVDGFDCYTDYINGVCALGATTSCTLPDPFVINLTYSYGLCDSGTTATITK